MVALGLVASGPFEDTNDYEPFHRFSLPLRTSQLVPEERCPARGQHQSHHVMIPPSIPKHSSAPNPIVALGLVASEALEDTHGNQTFHRFSVPLRTSQLVPQGRCPPGPPCDADLLCPQASFRGCPNPIVVLGLVASGLFEDTHGHQPFHRFSLLLRTSWFVLWGLCPARGQHQGHHMMLPHPFLCILWRPPQPYCGFGIGHIWAL